MQLRVLGCYGGETPDHRTSSFLVDDSLLLDAGSACSGLPLEDQLKIKHILLTHTHMDHIRSIPFLLDNVLGKVSHKITIWGIPEVLELLHDNLFNNMIWPDFTKIPTPEKALLVLNPLTPGQETDVDGYKVTAIPVNHTVPTAGFIVDNGEMSLLYSGDTAETDEIWKAGNERANLKVVLAETSFPAEMAKFGDLTKHLTSENLPGELKKLNRPEVPVYIYHTKPAHNATIKSELAAIEGYDIRIMADGESYSF
ncbi:MAG: 3',5'-cyclic-nucleotide phosphodiesterase [Nitrospirota bacterium]|nr:3',5'-cyclic-nucleotide phosphodiesterase [Nitrospirota bacterium]